MPNLKMNLKFDIEVHFSFSMSDLSFIFIRMFLFLCECCVNASARVYFLKLVGMILLYCFTLSGSIQEPWCRSEGDNADFSS